MLIPDDWKPEPSLLRDCVILVTGAGKGIGAAVAKACAAAGAQVVLLDLDIKLLEAVYDAIENAGGPQPAIYPLNLEGAVEKDYLELADRIGAEFNRLDGLVHNAAMLGALIPTLHFEAALWHRIMQVNLTGPFMLTRACLPLMMRTGDSSILFSSDRAGRHGRAYWGAYGVSKAGTECLMQILADELETNTHVRVNSIDPGPVATDLRALAYPGENPAQRPQPDDVVRPYLYLLSQASAGITGRQYSAQQPEALLGVSS
jgi:NAD(P)-dependent dehydrogenase (short-subunit alcohol dehydrogenase family)